MKKDQEGDEKRNHDLKLVASGCYPKSGARSGKPGHNGSRGC
jgi:hypothetical protein